MAGPLSSETVEARSCMSLTCTASCFWRSYLHVGVHSRASGGLPQMQ